MGRSARCPGGGSWRSIRAVGEDIRLSYRVKARRVGRTWEVEVPGLAGVLATSRDLRDASEMAAEALAGLLQLPVDAFDVVVEVRNA